MGAFTEVWSLRPAGSPQGAVKVWLRRENSSPLAGVGEDSAGVGGRSLETVTVRMRYRTDVGRSSVLFDPAGRLWLTNEVLAVGRRLKFLDVSLTRYDVDELSVNLPADRTRRVGRVDAPEEDSDRGYFRFRVVDVVGYASAQGSINVESQRRRPGRIVSPSGFEVSGFLLKDSFSSGGEYAFAVPADVFSYPIPRSRFRYRLDGDAGLAGLTNLDFVVLDA